MPNNANSIAKTRFVFPRPYPFSTLGTELWLAAGLWLAIGCSHLLAQETAAPQIDKNAEMLARRTIERLLLEDAFDAKLRQRIWAGGREVVGVGHYEQSGGGTGRFSLEMTIHDGDSRQTLKQLSDGKLLWHRAQVGGNTSIRRVDIGRIDEFERELWAAQDAAKSLATPDRLPSRLLAGGLVELLDQIANDFSLRLGKGTVEKQPVWILRGTLCAEARKRLQGMPSQAPEALSSLCPTEVRIAIAATPDANGFGAGLPIRIEFWSAPVADSPVSLQATLVSTSSSDSDSTSATDAPAGRLISLLEVYSMRKIEASPVERFLYVADDRAGTFVNDTQRYLDRVRRP